MAIFYEIAGSQECEAYEDTKGRLQVKAKMMFRCNWNDLNDVMAILDMSHYRHFFTCLPRRIRILPRGAISKYTYDGTEMSLPTTPYSPPPQLGDPMTAANLFTEAQYSEAIIEAYYSTEGPEYVMYGQTPILTSMHEELAPITLHISPPPGSYWAQNVPVTSQECSNPIQVQGLQHKLILSKLLTAPSDVFQFMNYVNTSAKSTYLLMSGFAPYSFAAGTVRNDGGFARVDMNWQQGRRYSVEYHHTFNPAGWNKYFRAGYGWVGVFASNGTTPLYEYPYGW